MYCINCGKSIPEFSKFCSHCGLSQTKGESTIKEKIADIIIETEILKQNIEKHHASMNLVFLKKIMGWYLTWVLIHLGLLLIFSDSIFASSNKTSPFWPFGENYRSISLSQYDIREFLVYTLFPLIILLIASWIIPHQKPISNTIPNNNTVVDKKPDEVLQVPKRSDSFRIAAIVGIIIIFSGLLFTIDWKPREQATTGSLPVQGYFIIKMQMRVPIPNQGVGEFLYRAGLNGTIRLVYPGSTDTLLKHEIFYYTTSYADTFTKAEKKQRISDVKRRIESHFNTAGSYFEAKGIKVPITTISSEIIEFSTIEEAKEYLKKL